MARTGKLFKILLTGDVMLGRGIDQALAYPSDPALHEPYVRDARDYIALAERKNGPILRPLPPDWVWGDALETLAFEDPDFRIINLETSITTSDLFEPKGINYRMNPRNIDCLLRLKPDCAVLSNNHVLDWGEAGLLETLSVLRGAGIQTAGAGINELEARRPAILNSPGASGRVLVFGIGLASSGVPLQWAAGAGRPGVWQAEKLSRATLLRIQANVAEHRRQNDVVILSLHWGENWGYEITAPERRFAHALIDSGAADLVHGHSSHHPKEMELYRGKLILYGCGDLINDYEGIGGYEEFRGDLSLLYLPEIDPKAGTLAHLKTVPMQMRNFRLHHASPEDARWLMERDRIPF